MTSNYETVTALGEQLRAGELTAVELSQRARGAADDSGPVFITTASDNRPAEHSDELLSAGKPRSALEGIPVAMKDVIATRGMRTTMGSQLFANNVPDSDARIVEQLRDAGANIVGKANTHEFSYGIRGDTSAFGEVPNPHEPSRISGGSSSGSAAAVAHGIVPLAVGTDTAGSIRVPAALCGVVGFKPTFDLLSTDGVFPLAYSFDTVGFLGTSIQDILVTFDALGYEGFAPETDGGASFDFRILEGNPGLSSTQNIESPIISLPDFLDFPTIEHPRFDGEYAPFRELFNTVRGREAYMIHRPNFAVAPQQYQQLTRKRVKAGSEVTEHEMLGAQTRIQQIAQRYLEVFHDHQMLISTTVPIDAPERGEPEGAGSEVLVSHSVIWNVLGWPALTVPYWVANDPLPKSVQVVGKPGRDADVLRAGQQIERIIAQQTGQ